VVGRILVILGICISVGIADSSNAWWNYPGLELWKFVNLLIFIASALYLHRRLGRPIREALRSRGEGIRRELLKARDERDQALAKLAEVDALFSNLGAEVAKVRERARAEADAEERRIAAATEEEIAKTREQSVREIERAGKAARHDLRRYAAEESIRLAGEILQREIGAEDDLRLTSLSVEELGRTGV
jgi:F0F1-type ATP synthase membrane subunit b/b'